MNKIFNPVLVICFITTFNQIKAQPPASDPVYLQLVDSAFTSLKNGNCQPCMELYQSAFARSKHSALSHLRAALCAEQCRDSAKLDYFIQAAVAINWGTCESVLDRPGSYPEFKTTGSAYFENKVRALTAQEAARAGINVSLKKRLSDLHTADQKYRQMLDSMQTTHRQDSPEYQAFTRDWRTMDSSNAAKIVRIIDQYGYPGRSLVGDGEASTAWLIIQHAPLEIQVKYLPVITEAAESGELRKSEWALLVDRIRMRQGKAQLYGSQLVRDKTTGQLKFHDIEDEPNVNQRRAEVGLEPLEAYAKQFGLEWKAPQKD